jgi:hypothetical protein
MSSVNSHHLLQLLLELLVVASGLPEHLLEVLGRLSTLVFGVGGVLAEGR